MSINIRKYNNIFEAPSTAKKKRRSIFDFNLDEIKKKNILIVIFHELILDKKKKKMKFLQTKKNQVFQTK